MNKFAVFILTNNRPSNVITLKTLRAEGYTGEVFLILDDQDKSAQSYRDNYPNEKVIIFSKNEASLLTDTADNTGNMKAVVYARNMCHAIAKQNSIDLFLVLDDDYTNFLTTTGPAGEFHRKTHKNLDQIFAVYCKFMEGTPTQTIAFAQGGDFIGGRGNQNAEKRMLSRKAMNSFFCKTDRPFCFYGLINEDVNMYVLDGSRGKLCFTSTEVQLNQKITQSNAGGLTTIYLELGTYVKSFYSVMYHPSSVTIKEMGSKSKRIHHSVNAELTYPKILREDVRGFGHMHD